MQRYESCFLWLWDVSALQSHGTATVIHHRRGRHRVHHSNRTDTLKRVNNLGNNVFVRHFFEMWRTNLLCSWSSVCSCSLWLPIGPKSSEAEISTFLICPISEDLLSSSRSSLGGGDGGGPEDNKGFFEGLASDSVSVVDASSDEEVAPPPSSAEDSSSGQRKTSISPLSHCMYICMPCKIKGDARLLYRSRRI